MLFVLSFSLSLFKVPLGEWKEEGGERRHENVESRGITGRA